MTTLEALTCPHEGVGEWRKRVGLSASMIGESKPTVYISPDSFYWNLEHIAVNESLNEVADKLGNMVKADQKLAPTLYPLIEQLMMEAGRQLHHFPSTVIKMPDRPKKK